MCVVCCVCYVMLCYLTCYVIKALGKEELVTMNNGMMILGIDPMFVLSILRSNSKVLVTN